MARNLLWLPDIMSFLPATWLALSLSGTGCVIPPPLERDTDVDAAVNSVPVITALDSSFPSPGPISLSSGDERTMSLTVRDNDLDDTVWVYFYVDYNYPLPVPRANDCQSSVHELDRLLTCPLNALCTGADAPDTLHFLEAMVIDRDLINNGGASFRAVPSGTGISFRSWLLTCTR